MILFFLSEERLKNIEGDNEGYFTKMKCLICQEHTTNLTINIYLHIYIDIYNLQIYGFKVDKARIDRTTKSREINNYNDRI